MKINKGNRSTRRKPAALPLYPQQIPHDLGQNKGCLGCAKPATKLLSYEAAAICFPYAHMQKDIFIVLKFDVAQRQGVQKETKS
jgi:hypothetical protein